MELIQQNKNWILFLVVLVLFSVLSSGLLLFVSSTQFRVKSKQFIAPILQQIPFLPDPGWSQSGEEKIIPIEIVNEL